MRIGPFDIVRRKAQQDLITHWPTPQAGWWPVVRESFSGAWQRQIRVSVDDAATHPTFWSCITLIAGDIAKLEPELISERADGICEEVENPAYSPVLDTPNHYQDRIQFYTYWILSKLMRGNAYALKERNHRGAPNAGTVDALYLLDPTRVRPMVSPDGDVFYALQRDPLSGITKDSDIVPAREIVHDRMFPLYHPLCGLSPVYACGHASMQGLKIIENSTRLFEQGSMVGGVLTAPDKISNEAAERIQKHWDENYAGSHNAGRVAVLGDGLKFDKPPVMSAVDAQLIDQLKWGDEKICGVFHVPAYMAGVGPAPLNNNVDALYQQYYQQCLQILIESVELCLTKGLELKKPLKVRMDLDGLLRMDSAAAMKFATDGVKGMVFTPNDARARFNLKPLPGGDTVFGQEQDHSLQWLATRDSQPIAPVAPAAPPIADVPAPKKALHAKDVCATCGGVGLLPESCMGDPNGQIACPDCEAGADIMREIGDQVDDIETEAAEMLLAELSR